MSKVSYKPVSAWGWQKPTGSFYPDTFSKKIAAVEYFSEAEYKGNLAKVWIVPYKSQVTKNK